MSLGQEKVNVSFGIDAKLHETDDTGDGPRDGSYRDTDIALHNYLITLFS
jgi:hypothetical protein